MLHERTLKPQDQIANISPEAISAETAKSIEGYLPLVCRAMKDCKSAALTLGAILYHIDRDGVSTRKSSGYFAEMLGITIKTIQNHVRVLGKEGYLRRTGKTGKTHTTILVKPREAFLAGSSAMWLPMPIYALREEYGLNWASLATFAAFIYKGQDSRDHSPENWCGPSELSRITGVSIRSVKAACAALENAGLIARSGGGNGRHSKTVLLMPVQKTLTEDQPVQNFPTSAEPVQNFPRSEGPVQNFPRSVEPVQKFPRGGAELDPEPVQKLPTNIEETKNLNPQMVVGGVELKEGKESEATNWIVSHRHAKAMLAFDDPALIIAIWYSQDARAVSLAFTKTAVNSVVQSVAQDDIKIKSKWVYWKIGNSFPIEDVKILESYAAASRPFAGEVMSDAMLALWPKCNHCNGSYDPDSNARFTGFCSTRCEDESNRQNKTRIRTKTQEEIEAESEQMLKTLEEKAGAGCTFSIERLARIRRTKKPPG